MEFINICQRKFYKGRIHSSSSCESDTTSAEKLLTDDGFWCTKKRSAGIKEFVVIDFEKESAIDYIKITASGNGASAFPSGFRLEGSDDAEVWSVLYSETNTSLDSNVHEVHLPLTVIRYLKILITDPAVLGSNYYSEIGKVEAGIFGVEEINASSYTEGNGPENLLSDGNSFWETEQAAAGKMENVCIDLGKVCCLNRIMMTSSIDGFPDTIHIETSVDNEIWITLIHENGFEAEPNRKYGWLTDIRPARFVRLEAPAKKFLTGKYGVRVADLGISAAPVNHLHTHNVGDIAPHASVFHAGMVRLARDGESEPGRVVQSTDARLRDASTVFKGIVQLANDGESRAGIAVQSNDSRIQPATEIKPGIVKLAYDRETTPESAVQASDSRLQHATEDNFGIVRLCSDGEYREHSVVSGNDSRLQKSTTTSSGIVILAEDGGEKQGTVVQGNDRRLKDATTYSKGIVQIAGDGAVVEGSVVLSTDRRLKEATTVSKGIVELAEDGEDSPGVAVQGNDRRLKDATTSVKGIVELAEDGEERDGVAVQGSDSRLKDATTSAKGIVELAEDGETAPGVVVQGNDRRLKDATTTARGIVELAEDGEDKNGVAVQGNDKRLKPATTISTGIVRFSQDGGTEPFTAVQGNDKRLRDATTSAKGIVELAEDGEDREGVVVQGSDRRLKEASETSYGIMKFAADGGRDVLTAVQGNDKRLRDATTSAKGIVELAENGEDKDGVVVQGSDKRLRYATTISSGIVELAENGEDASGVVVQGDDRRLKAATESAAGIVKLAKNGESTAGAVVQADDIRLSDSREPLPHTHEYAHVMHDHNSHTGTVAIRAEKNEPFSDVTPPSDGSSVVYANNTSEKTFAIGVTGIAGANAKEKINAYGVIGHSRHVGVRGQATGDSGTGAGVAGSSRFGAGGIFSSEHDFSLIADGYGSTMNSFDSTMNLQGEGKAILAMGISDFHGRVNLKGDGKNLEFPGGIVELFEVDEAEFVTPGDLLVVSENGNSVLSRSKSLYNRGVIGIVSGNPYLAINNSGREEKLYPVSLSGKALCRIDARNNPVKPGDLIVASDTPGCGMKGKIDSFDKIGTVIGKALDSLSDGIGLVPVFIVHM
ncbi:MAG TPA: discoidin domain-containing protein [Spirochaetota bacterium]|nr:discoidin domain-containing protein [Spirochaetota bacterium]HPF06678.1 discoidin domain-containing protein [Spirochaetota bacterium]HPJ41735.1 discoidin domain-containing protein [Spirochaetota bacterium]HPR36646.1 discoidin domain-containing protein [Spirochaetota bacterium]HRX47711.1 discoidin domain-containing protein [Spirochaetota bacterium]